jgi:hypothetical protein
MNLAHALLLIIPALVPDPEQRAQDVLAHSREALGASKRPATLRGFSLEAELRRVQPIDGGEANDLSGELTVDVQLPDRYLKVETLAPFPGGPAFSVGTGLDGGEAWRAPIGNAGGPNMVVRIFEREGPGATDALLRRTRGEMLRLMLLVLASNPADALTFTHAGEAEAPEGRADRIDVGDAQGRVGTLFVDQATHRPLFLSFETSAPRMQTMRVMRHEGGERPRLAEPPPAAPAPDVEARLYVSDWKAVDGVLVPHHVSQTIEGGPREEWTIRKWRLDPSFKADHFRRRK